jgi:hypothetical protein
MPDVTDPHRGSPAEVLLAALADDVPGRDSLDRLRAALRRSLVGDDPAAALPRRLSVEPQARLTRGTAEAAGVEEPALRVFRRETPVKAPDLGLATPDWGRGAAVAESLGPFPGRDGRLFWFDFFPIVRLVPVYLAGDPLPAFLFNLHQRRPGPFSVHDALALLQAGRRYDLAAGSVWLRADLLAAAAPAGTYLGLRVDVGHLTFTQPVVAVGGKVTIPVGGRCAVELDLQPTAHAPGAGGRAGKDADAAKLTTPRTFSFVLAAGHAAVDGVGRAAWVLYGQGIDFDWRQGPAPAYEPLLNAVVVPMHASAPAVQPGPVASPFAGPVGRAKVHRAGWALPVAAIDVTHPTEAAGAGGLAVQTGDGLTLTWAGLQDGPVRLPAPWVVVWPGVVAVTDPHASNREAHQTLRLWKGDGSKFRSELALRYGDDFGVAYFASSAGAEVVTARAAVEARLDRPVDVKGTPLPVHTLGSLLALGFTDTLRLASVYDDNILVDALDPQATWPLDRGRAVSLAIRNALFTTTPVNSLFLFAELRDAEFVSRATLLLGLGLYGLLPTLPDPYASEVGAFRRLGRGSLRSGSVGQVLVADVAWTKADGDENPDAVASGFAFAPVGTQEVSFAAWAAAQEATRPGAAPAADSASFSSPPGGSDQGRWGPFFRRFDQEQFALLDVSSNADQMGVSFAWFEPARLNPDDLVFGQVFGPKGGATPPPAPAFPLEVRDLDLSAQARFVRAFTVPQLSWEPVVNLTQGTLADDPPVGFNLYPDDGGPTRILNDGVEVVPIAPLPVVDYLVRDFAGRVDGFTGALFALPFGLKAFAEFSRRNQFQPGVLPGAKVAVEHHGYEGGTLAGGLQLRVDAPPHPRQSPIFKGSTFQLDNVLRVDGSPAGAGTLGHSVGIVFNKEFFLDGNTGYKDRGVPLTRIDFSGYGASIFSHWDNPDAAIAATSQAHFDVLVGRTAHEVVQVRSLVYPWGIRVVRTITLFRTSSAHFYRFDAGWRAESAGVYDFRYNVYNNLTQVIPQPSPYTFHPGVVGGVFNVRNIRETTDVPPFRPTWTKKGGDSYVDDNGVLQTVLGKDRSTQVELQPLYFDADVKIEGATAGATKGLVPSKEMLGYVQLAPRGEPLPPELFALLLGQQFGALGGPVNCVVNVGGSGQLMRVARVDVNAAKDGAGKPIFVSAGRGSMVLPKDGSWSVVQHNQGTGEVSPVDPQATVPLVRRGRLDPASGKTDATDNDLFRLANPVDLVQAPSAATRNYGLLQSTGTQKALFRLPSFQKGVDQVLGAPPDFADAYRLVNSSGIFPLVQDALPLALGAFRTKILDEGYKLLDQADPNKVFEQVLPEGPLYLINEDFLKIYVEYAPKDKNGNKQGDGTVKYGFDAAAADLGKKWLAKVNDIGMVVDLGPLKRLMMIKGRFDAEKGATPGFVGPQLVFSDDLQPVIDILQILLSLSEGDYKAAFQKGLEVAMSNSAESWNYAFHARKEIPLVKFPPGPLYDAPTNPLKLEAHLAVGVYFNEAFQLTTDVNQLVPSAGAFLEFGGRLSVMCVSLAAATVYATGSVDLRTAADIKTGPSLRMKFGFGAEIVVGLPVVGDVSVLYMVGVEMDLNTSEVTVTGFLLFRGRAEILGGVVTVTIMIEAKGSVKRSIAQQRTDLVAQVTFGIDISIFLVINIHFSQSWQESRQIA